MAIRRPTNNPDARRRPYDRASPTGTSLMAMQLVVNQSAPSWRWCSRSCIHEENASRADRLPVASVGREHEGREKCRGKSNYAPVRPLGNQTQLPLRPPCSRLTSSPASMFWKSPSPISNRCLSENTIAPHRPLDSDHQWFGSVVN